MKLEITEIREHKNKNNEVYFTDSLKEEYCNKHNLLLNIEDIIKK